MCSQTSWQFKQSFFLGLSKAGCRDSPASRVGKAHGQGAEILHLIRSILSFRGEITWRSYIMWNPLSKSNQSLGALASEAENGKSQIFTYCAFKKSGRSKRAALATSPRKVANCTAAPLERRLHHPWHGDKRQAGWCAKCVASLARQGIYRVALALTAKCDWHSQLVGWPERPAQRVGG